MTSSSAEIIDSKLSDYLLSEDEILSQIEMREHIFEIKNETETLGFISLYDLKNYLADQADDIENYFVKNIDHSEWKNIYDHPSFQRRKPQLISTETFNRIEDDHQFYILQKGQKAGPYEKNQLLEMLKNKEILLTDMVSFNAGLIWNKLYQIDGFERRELSMQLPGMPETEIINQPSSHINALSEATDAIGSLAFLGNLKRGKSFERERQNFKDDEQSKITSNQSMYKWLLAGSLVGIVFFLINIKSHLKAPSLDKLKLNSVGEKSEVLTPVEEIAPRNNRNVLNNQRRAKQMEARRMPPVQPVSKKSYMESPNMMNTIDEQNSPQTEDSNYYFDNSTPMELDPVQAQISKENFDNGGEAGDISDAESLFAE